MKKLPATLNPKKPDTCYVWGVGPETIRVLDILKQAAIDVEGLVDPSGVTQEHAGIPVISPDYLKQQCGQYPSRPVVISRGCFDLLPVIPDSNVAGSYHTFKNEWLSAKYRYEIEVQLLHPDFISDFLPLKYNNRYFVCGAPGAGNVLTQSILGRMLGGTRKRRRHLLFNGFRKPALADGKLELTAASLATNYFSQTLVTLNESANVLGRWRTDLSSDGLGYTNLRMHFPLHNVIEVKGIRSRRHLFTEVYGSHEIPTPENIQRYRDMNFKTVICIRHPYDIMISFINKWIENKSNDIPVIYDHEVLGLFSKEIISLYDAALKSREFCYFIRYENLLQSPSETICSLANAVGISISPPAATAIWYDLGFKPLPMAPENHFARPGVNKWRTILSTEEIKFLDETGLAALAVELGYPPPIAADCRPAAEKSSLSIRASELVRKCHDYTQISLFDSVYLDVLNGANEEAAKKHAEILKASYEKTPYIKDWLRLAEYNKAGL